MNRNTLYLIIGGLIVGAGVLGYQLYQERQKPGFSISVGGKEGLKIGGHRENSLSPQNPLPRSRNLAEQRDRDPDRHQR